MSQVSSQLHVVAALVDEGSNPFELACLTEVLGIDRPEVGGLLYDLQICARQPTVPMRQGFFAMTGIATLSALQRADTVIVPNRPDTATSQHPDVLDAIAQAHGRGARMIGMCSGAFTLAEAAVLDGRRVTLHWQWAEEFRARYPRVHVDDGVLFVDDGDILTSAGSAAALDLALHVVRRDHGAEIGTAVARRLVFPGHRPGGQRQFIERPIPKETESPLAAALAWAEQHATEPISVADIASRAAMSPASLHRRFRNELGSTPIQWLTSVRVEHARRLLEQTDLAVDQIAHRSGLGSAANLRTRLADQTGLTPSAYRRAFSTRLAEQGHRSHENLAQMRSVSNLLASNNLTGTVPELPRFEPESPP
ncbi:MAG TPA: helix-turn-helix domain-containing protein [Amycolatopsis sp.]|nr:helix-turn-helix domain-containing protein [Amycolatopsis sp.]